MNGAAAARFVWVWLGMRRRPGGYQRQLQRGLRLSQSFESLGRRAWCCRLWTVRQARSASLITCLAGRKRTLFIPPVHGIYFLNGSTRPLYVPFLTQRLEIVSTVVITTLSCWSEFLSHFLSFLIWFDFDTHPFEFIHAHLHKAKWRRWLFWFDFVSTKRDDD